MQYWKPAADDEFAGDMMPYWDGKRFHLFYLLDRGHHAEQNGLGGHQWAHASTSDLVTWEHHPLAVPIGAPGTIDQHGICTGSIFEHEGVYHAFYACRVRNEDGSISEVVCRAASRDLIHFEKSPPNPLFSAPPGYGRGDHRDPFVFRDAETGVFHMLVTASRDGVGVLAHYTSGDLDAWEPQEPFLIGRDHHTPECPELFFSNGWWTLVYSHHAQLEYRIARGPLGPWQIAGRETIEASTLRVPRTAAFRDGRRLAVGFLAWRDGDHDAGDYVYAGNVVFRELLQSPDGTLSTNFIAEMMPPTGPAQAPSPEISLTGQDGPRTLLETPADSVLTLRLVPGGGASEYGLLLRSEEHLKTSYRLSFSVPEGRMTLRAWPESPGPFFSEISGIPSLDQGVDVVVCMKDSIIDLCVNGQRTTVERCCDHRGTYLGGFVSNGSLTIGNLHAAPIV